MTASLKDLLKSSGCKYMLEAHDALSGLVAQEAGFAAVWGSSLTFSARAGRRDDSELSVEHALCTVEYMADRLAIPILFDGDSGHGSFNQFALLVKRLAKRGAAGVCIEDKVFPKSNSFINSSSQKLETLPIFVGKLRAGLDARPDDNFVIVARTEALVTGDGMDEALRRAHAFADANVDAVLVHSSASNFDEIREFMERWDRSVPILCVPTRFPNTLHEVFEQSGVRMVIWANHLLRASLLAMQKYAAGLALKFAPATEEGLASLEEVFRLQNTDELERARKLYHG